MTLLKRMICTVFGHPWELIQRPEDPHYPASTYWRCRRCLAHAPVSPNSKELP